MDLHPPLIDLLGASWRFEAAITGVAWSLDGAAAAFGLGEGAILLARARWSGGPDVRARASGGMEVIPPTVASPPVSRVAVHNSASSTIAAVSGGFLSLGADGDVVRIDAAGCIETVADLVGSRVDVLATGDGACRASAAGCEVVLAGRSQARLTLPRNALLMAFDRAGRRLAAAYQDGVEVWSLDSVRLHHWPFQGAPKALAWSPNGAWLGIVPDGGDLRIWRLIDGREFVPGGQSGGVLSFDFSLDGRCLAAGGAPSVRYWQLDPLSLDSAGACGLASRSAPVCRVAFHPTRPLIAAGYRSGAVLLCRPGSEGALFVKGPGGGATSALAWSADGERLAIGTEEGEAGLVFLPGSLFRG